MTKLFNIYYVNFQKVFEVAMMIDNRVTTQLTVENEKSQSNSKKITASVGSKIGRYIAEIDANLSSETSEYLNTTSKISEMIELKMTKSIYLNKLLRKATIPDTLKTMSAGDLVKIDNVQLKIMNEESLRQFLLLRRDALKGMRVEGIDVNNLVSSLLSDYTYVLVGECANGELLAIKIPIEAKSEFESKYNIDDLLIGKVSVVGVFRDIVNQDYITRNTFTYFADAGAAIFPETRIVESNMESPLTTVRQSDKASRLGELSFIDIIAIIQDVNYKETIDTHNEPKTKECFLRRLFGGKK